MAVYNESNADCTVTAFKEGLLAKAAHDLEMRCERFEIRVEETSHAIEAWFDPSSLRVTTAYSDAIRGPEELSEHDLSKIHHHIAEDVLHTREFPEVRFISSRVDPTDDGFSVTGTLTLRGNARPLHTDIRSEGGRWVADVSLDQPEFGIKPFRAVLGAIRIKPGVEVRVSVPKD